VPIVADDGSTEELKRQQANIERVEQKRADEAVTEDEAAAHRRRAEKAAYLGEKLAEQEQSED
jgi:hypothetical protein